jgi:hypothetical protein
MRRSLVTCCILVTAACSGKSPDVTTRSPDGGELQDAKKTIDADRRETSADAAASDSGGGVEGQGDAQVVGPITIYIEAGLPASQRVLDEALAIVGSAKSTTYTHTTFIDESTGTYDVDCSGFTNFVLQQVDAPAFATLVEYSSPRPYAAEYARFYAALPTAGTGSWHPVVTPMELVPGDIVAWVEPPQLNSTDTGHVMVVAEPPVAANGEVDVKIIDSTSTGHGDTDPRTAADATGVGEGTVAITVSDAGAPTGYRWAAEPGVLAYTTTVGMGHVE